MQIVNWSELLQRIDRAHTGSEELDLRVLRALYPLWEVWIEDETAKPWKAMVRTESGMVCHVRLDPFSRSLDEAIKLMPPGAEWRITNLYGIADVEAPLNGDESFSSRRKDGNIVLATLSVALQVRAHDMDNQH